ncbi:O-methyltransferase [Colletotrichum salicis]|uniref:O-methyltransferase n=1 Tax=Colletotrichum salicis TaxID=1209931 RepID=A0A135T090_9PEZI|nr:O-methyltransferase [Colletotrichum salicis]
MTTEEQNTVTAADAIESVARANLLPPNEKLDNAIANSQKHDLPEFTASPLQGQFFAIQCKLIGPKDWYPGRILDRLAAEGRKFDMVLCDASWGEQEKYFDWAVELTRPKGCIYIDNVVWNILSQGKAKEGKESLLSYVGKDERVTATLVPMRSTAHTVHEGRTVLDGFLLAVVNQEPSIQPRDDQKGTS